jgi:hypothetical protein
VMKLRTENEDCLKLREERCYDLLKYSLPFQVIRSNKTCMTMARFAFISTGPPLSIMACSPKHGKIRPQWREDMEVTMIPWT